MLFLRIDDGLAERLQASGMEFRRSSSRGRPPGEVRLVTSFSTPDSEIDRIVRGFRAACGASPTASSASPR
jgi:threonine aldolase